jgi:hypothetical protein
VVGTVGMVALDGKPAAEQHPAGTRQPSASAPASHRSCGSPLAAAAGVSPLSHPGGDDVGEGKGLLPVLILIFGWAAHTNQTMT